MNKTAIKNFAIWSRNKLIADIQYKAGLMGITEKGIANALPQSTRGTEFYDIGTSEPYTISGKEIEQRRRLKEVIENKASDTDYATAYKYVIEEVAYSWFNRLIAVRFMEVNDYLPGHIRVLSSETGKMEPDLVTTPFDADLEFTGSEEEQIIQLKQDNKIDELFRLLFIKQCNALNELLPALFEKTNDYTEILLNLSVIDQEGVVYHLVHDIPEEDFDVNRGGQVEIIGWLYQYYNTELNEVVYDGNMSKSRVTKDLLPAATTIYTPDWAIQYMVQNSLVRMWVKSHRDTPIGEWKYYLDENEQPEEMNYSIDNSYKNVKIEDIKFLDPCMGSGHILVYAFEVFMTLYELQGYPTRDIPELILTNNIYGLDIDNRAAQLAYFAIMMKACQYDRRFLRKKVRPNVYSIPESNSINKNHVEYLGISLEPKKREKASSQVKGILNNFTDAKEYGSILNIPNYDWNLIKEFIDDTETNEGQMTFETMGLEETRHKLLDIVSVAKVLSQKYCVVVTNPPYLGNSRFSPKLDEYVKLHFPEVKTDLSMVMYKHAIEKMCEEHGYVSFITTSSWMTLSSFELLRKYIQDNVSIISLVDFGTELFEGKVGHNPIVAWVTQKVKIDCKMTAIRLVEYCYSRRAEKEIQYFNENNRHYVKQSSFLQIPGEPIAYWMNEHILRAFSGTKIGDIGTAKVGIGSGNTEYFLKLWYELNINDITFGATKDSREEIKYAPINKGGPYRKWYGNNGYVINWFNDGAELKNYSDENGKKLSYPRNLDYQLKASLTWGDISSGDFSLRYSPEGYFFSDVGNSLFIYENKYVPYILAFGNTKLFNMITKFLNQTMHFKPGNMMQMPIIIKDEKIEEINEIVYSNIELSKEEWDSFEISWDFKTHPLILFMRKFEEKRIEQVYYFWEQNSKSAFDKLRKNEEKLNSIFNTIFGVQNEMGADIEESAVSLKKADLSRDIRSLISYAVGCMFGRYSLDEEGISYAGGAWDESKYTTFIPDTDNCIPITDTEYFEDDIVGLFCTWLKKVYGEDTLEENLDFIAKALGKKGNSSREIIRNYFLTDFYKDHCSTYSVTGSGKRPIYWLFDSGKQNGFKALIYLHRYTPDTIGNLRVDYLHRMQRVYESEMNRMQDMIEHSTNSREVAAASKRKEKLQKQLKECREYDEKIGHLALDRIELDLDDGVKYNYRKIQTGRDGKFYEVLADSKAIMMDAKKYADFKK